MLLRKAFNTLFLNSGDTNSKSPQLSDTITAHFHGTLTDGTVFWSSVESNEPLTVQLIWTYRRVPKSYFFDEKE